MKMQCGPFNGDNQIQPFQYTGSSPRWKLDKWNERCIIKVIFAKEDTQFPKAVYRGTNRPRLPTYFGHAIHFIRLGIPTLCRNALTPWAIRPLPSRYPQQKLNSTVTEGIHPPKLLDHQMLILRRQDNPIYVYLCLLDLQISLLSLPIPLLRQVPDQDLLEEENHSNFLILTNYPLPLQPLSQQPQLTRHIT